MRFPAHLNIQYFMHEDINHSHKAQAPAKPPVFLLTTNFCSKYAA